MNCWPFYTFEKENYRKATLPQVSKGAVHKITKTHTGDNTINLTDDKK